MACYDARSLVKQAWMMILYHHFCTMQLGLVRGYMLAR